MKVYIGRPPSYLLPYKVIKFFLFWKTDQECLDLVNKVPFVTKFCNMINDRLSQKIVVKSHDYDLYSAYTIISSTVLPLLKKARTSKLYNNETLNFIDDDDAPDILVYTNYNIEKWHAILDDIIWSFTVLATQAPYDTDNFEKHVEKMQRGFMLFGKYYMHIFV